MHDYETMERDNLTTKSFMFYLFSFCSYQTMWRHNAHMSPSTCRYWNRMQYRHRFDVLSIALLMTTQLSAVAYSGRAPDCLVRTDTRHGITLFFSSKNAGILLIYGVHHFLQPGDPGKPMETWVFSPPCSRVAWSLLLLGPGDAHQSRDLPHAAPRTAYDHFLCH